MGYTWEDVALGVDIRQEAVEEAREMRDIEKKRRKESEAMAGWSLIGSMLLAPLGPAGYFIGQQLGKYAGDVSYDWEGDIKDFDPGKFNIEEGRMYKEDIESLAEEQNIGQILGAVTDLASAYVMGGGFGEGPMDWTTFGSGEDQWRFFQRGTPEQTILVPGKFYEKSGEQVYQTIPASADYVPSIFEGGFKPLGSLSDIGVSSMVNYLKGDK